MTLSIIIPTIWTPGIEFISKSIEELQNSASVTEIIIIDNKPCDYNFTQDKVKHIKNGQNKYVGPSWNQGVRIAKGEIICLLNDDIRLDAKAIEHAVEMATKCETGIIGFDINCLRNNVTRPIYEERTELYYSYGCAMFMKRIDYKPIPESIKIYYTDNFLFDEVPGIHYAFIGAKAEGEIGASSERDAFSKIRERDRLEWIIHNSFK